MYSIVVNIFMLSAGGRDADKRFQMDLGDGQRRRPFWFFLFVDEVVVGHGEGRARTNQDKMRPPTFGGTGVLKMARNNCEKSVYQK